MALKREALTRVFLYQGITMPDPDSTLAPQAVRDLFAAAGRPELATAEVIGPERIGGDLQYTFQRKIGTKGLKPAVEDGVEYAEATAEWFSNVKIDPKVAAAIASITEKSLALAPEVEVSIAQLTAKRDSPEHQAITAPSSLVYWFF